MTMALWLMFAALALAIGVMCFITAHSLWWSSRVLREMLPPIVVQPMPPPPPPVSQAGTEREAGQ